MLRAVFDANVYVSAALIPGSTPWRLLAACRLGVVFPLFSPAISEEVRRVLLYPKIRSRHGLTLDGVDRFLKNIWRVGACVTPLETFDAVPADPSDNRYLECAVAGRADAVVSGDRHLLGLGSFQGIPILHPARFLALVEGTGPG